MRVDEFRKRKEPNSTNDRIDPVMNSNSRAVAKQQTEPGYKNNPRQQDPDIDDVIDKNRSRVATISPSDSEIATTSSNSLTAPPQEQNPKKDKQPRTKAYKTDTNGNNVKYARLLKDWIQFLKNNRIVALKSDPNSGKLSYNREVTSEDVIKFLKTFTDHSEEEINDAIQQTLSGKSPSGSPETNGPEQQSQQQSTQQTAIEPPEKQRSSPGNVDDVEDVVDKRRTLPPSRPGLPAPKKPHYKMQNGKPVRMNEDLIDDRGPVLDEQDIESIFKILGADSTRPPPPTAPSGQQRNSKGSKKSSPQASQAAQQAERTPEQKQEDIKKIVRVIRDKMSDNQRQMLWRALNES